MSVADVDAPLETPWRGKFVEVKRRGRWEYASRPRAIFGVVIVAIDAGEIILIEQYRVPLGQRCLELPAGLVGDETEGEDAVTAGARELEEETGYRAARVESLGDFYSSPGMIDERLTLVRATGLTRVGEGGGDGNEDIAVHRVRVGEVGNFIAAKRADGVAIDVKLLLLLAGDLLGEQ